jgi:hypothetical protein
VSLIVCVVLYAVSFVRGVILCDVCYLFLCLVVLPLPQGKRPFAVKNKSLISKRKMEATYPSEASVDFQRTTGSYIPEYKTLLLLFRSILSFMSLMRRCSSLTIAVHLIRNRIHQLMSYRIKIFISIFILMSDNFKLYSN